MEISSPQPALSFQKTVELADSREVAWYAWRRSKLKATIVVCIATVFLAAWVGSQISGFSFWYWLPFWVVGAPLIFAFINYLAVTKYAQRQADRAQKAGPETWRISDEGIDIESSEATVALKWSAIINYRETKGLVLLQLARTALAIPTRCLSAQDHASLLQWLDRKNVARAS